MKMEPRVSHPMIEWEEACEQVADKLGPYEEWLRTYISKHGAVLSKDVRKMLDACSSLAALNKFNIQGEDVSREQSRAAGELLDTMEKCEKVFLEEVQS
jgi:thiaminase